MSNPYMTYYVRQNGGALPYYAGGHRQRGHGLGGLLKGVFRMAQPLLGPVIKSVGQQAVREGMGLVGDILGGNNLRRAAGQRLKRVGQTAVTSLANTALGAIKRSATPSGSRKKKVARSSRRAPRTQGKAKKNRRRKGGRRSGFADIFG